MKGGYFSALSKFALYQFKIRFDKEFKFVNIGNFCFFKAQRGVSNSSGIYYVGLMEYEEQRSLLQYVRSEDLFIDIGANIGTYSIPLSAYSGCTCIAFEPDADNYKNFSDNVRINLLNGRIKTEQMAIADYDGNIGFSSGMDAISHISTKDDFLVKCQSLDSYFNTNKVRPNIIKIDVEGFESLVISGFSTLTNGFKPQVILIELRGHGKAYGFNENEIFDYIIKLGYTSVKVDFKKMRIIRRDFYQKGDHLFVYDEAHFLDRVLEGNQKFKLCFGVD